MEQAERERAVEAILFALGEPVPTARLAQALDAEEDQVLAACQALAAFYETQARGIRLVQLEESWQLVSAPRWGAVIRGLLARKKPDKLSASALETLALVAYFQPVTRVYLDQARGVDSAHSLGVLLDRELVEPCGTLDAPGRPTLYRTTQTFCGASACLTWQTCRPCRRASRRKRGVRHDRAGDPARPDPAGAGRGLSAAGRGGGV